MNGQDESLMFWNNAEVIYETIIHKTCEGRVLTEQEALTFIQLGRMLEQYFKLQRLILDSKINEMEQKDDDDLDGLANSVT